MVGTTTELGRLHLRMPTTAGTDPVIHFSDAAGDDCGSIDLNASANTVAYTTSSDYRLKENVNYSWDATTELKKLKPAKFNFKAICLLNKNVIVANKSSFNKNINKSNLGLIVI